MSFHFILTLLSTSLITILNGHLPSGVAMANNNILLFFLSIKEMSLIQKKETSRDHLPGKEKSPYIAHERINIIHREKWVSFSQTT